MNQKKQYDNSMEFQSIIIWIDVLIIDQVSSKLHKIKTNQASTLKIVIDQCKEQKKISNYREETMLYIEIGDVYYHEGEDRNLFEVGLYNVQQINIYIFQKRYFYQLQIVFSEMDELIQLIKNYDNILFSFLDQYDQKLILLKEQEILLQNYLNPDKYMNIQVGNEFLLKKQHLINNAFRWNLKQNRLKKNLIDPLDHQQQILNTKNKNELDLLMLVLAKQFQMQGQKLYKTRRYDQQNILSLQSSFAYGLDYTTCLSLTILNNKEISYQQLQDKKKFRIFQEQIKVNLAFLLKLRPEDIILLQVDEGSIKVFFQITNEAGEQLQIQLTNSQNQIQQLYPGAQLVLHKYFQEIQLSRDDFDPQYNMEWNQNNKIYELRGPKQDQIKYFFPKGWKGYALNVKGKYDEGNDDWLKMDGNPNEWHIMYHGTEKHCVRGILENGFITNGGRQQYKQSTDIRQNVEVGVGVYFSNHIEVAEQYADPVKINGVNYRVVFQSRVRPQSLKQIKKLSSVPGKKRNPDWDNDYFVVNKSEDIRPYRILLKKEKQILLKKEKQIKKPQKVAPAQGYSKKKHKCVIF